MKSGSDRHGQGLGFLVGGIVLDKKALGKFTAELVAAVMFLAPVIASYSVDGQATTVAVQGLKTYALSAFETPRVRAAMLGHNVSCSYENVSLGSVLWLKTDDQPLPAECVSRTRLLMTPDAINYSSFPSNAALVPGLSVKSQRNPLFVEGSAAWEAYIDNGYVKVIFDPSDQLNKTWNSSNPGQDAKNDEGYRGLLIYRESTNGVNWPMPSLGIVPYNGSTANNVVNGYMGGIGVSLDEASTTCRFKAVGSTGGLKRTGAKPGCMPEGFDCKGNGSVFCSPDGKR